MAKSDRNQAEHKASRPSRRGVLRRGRKDESSRARKAGSPPSEAKNGGSNTQPGDQEKVSSMLKTTSNEVKQLLEAADDAAGKIREAAKVENVGREVGGKGEEAPSLVGRINKEAQRVLESADEAAEMIREEARAEARQLIEEARRRAEIVTSEQMELVSAMTDQVLGEASAVQGQLDDLRNAFERAIKAMNADLDTAQSEIRDTHPNGVVDSDEDSEAVRRRLGQRPRHKPATQQSEGVSEGARLLVLQQLMAGEDTEVIEARLKDEFGIEDPKPILEQMNPQGEKPKKPKND